MKFPYIDTYSREDHKDWLSNKGHKMTREEAKNKLLNNDIAGMVSADKILKAIEILGLIKFEDEKKPAIVSLANGYAAGVERYKISMYGGKKEI